jgi:hypothetical protein
MANNLVKAKPTATIGTIATGVTTTLAELVTHGVISEHAAKTWGPLAVLAVVGISFLATWFHVTPVEKAEVAFAQLEDGRLPDADLARIEAMVHDVVHDVVHGGDVEPPPAPTGPDPTAPPMNAGTVQ